MKISILSDLHLEVSNIKMKKINCDIMILAGDIGSGTKALPFIKHHLNLGVKHILYVLGNHEFYDDNTNNIQNMSWGSSGFFDSDLFANVLYSKRNPDSYQNTIDTWLELDKQIKGLHVLHNKEFIYENIRFLGTTLWTDYGKNASNMHLATQTMNDYKYITHKNDNLTPHSVFNFHIESKKWLERQLSNKSPLKTIVITHHLPSFKCISEKFQNDVRNCFYASNLDYLMEKYEIEYWIHGHTHVTVYEQIYNTRVICNPRGYCDHERENSDFNYFYTITV